MRDAFTLFDQVVSFSAGSIRGDLIREKLGITGLEKLNELAEMCAANNAPGAFALTGEILDSGVSIEQFVIDLAGYYRSLLLLKNGVTRESLLGYRPSLFSAKTLETFDSVRLEQALELLLDCYRDIRYSVSPRFELETAVSKLSWLSRWISPTELGEALESARGIFGSAGLVRQTAQGTSASTSTARNSSVPASAAPRQSTGGGRSLSDELKRMLAAKENGASSNSDGTSSDGKSADGTSSDGTSSDGMSADDDVPLWDSAVSKKSEETETPPQVENVLSMIPGTVVG
jgi:DNA polymerase-3 subunit gamma/tau